MEAFQNAYDMGFRFFETDLHFSRDRRPVVFHDDVVDRTTSGTGLVADRSVHQLAELDAGYWFKPEEDYPARGQGIRIPPLEELLTTFPDCYFTLELKHAGMAHSLALLIRRLDRWDSLIVGAANDRWTAAFRVETGGRVATSAGQWTILGAWLTSRIGRGLKVAAAAFQVPLVHRGLTVIDREFVAAAHAAERQVHAWTVDQPSEMKALLDLGVDGIMSDRPDVLKKVLIERGEGGPWNG